MPENNFCFLLNGLIINAAKIVMIIFFLLRRQVKREEEKEKRENIEKKNKWKNNFNQCVPMALEKLQDHMDGERERGKQCFILSSRP